MFDIVSKQNLIVLPEVSIGRGVCHHVMANFHRTCFSRGEELEKLVELVPPAHFCV
jgi:hypothetical protein